jgi:transposase-like protein/ribosomal protein L37E
MKIKSKHHQLISLDEFNNLYGTDEKCRDFLLKQRFPNGFICPKCGHTHAYFIKTRDVQKCAKCGFQVSPTAGTIFHKSTTPLHKWFQAIYYETQTKDGISALNLMSFIHVTYKTAWLILQKIRISMKTANDKYLLEGIVKVDETYLGGDSKKNGKRGRGTGKSKIVVALSEDKNGKPKYLKMQILPDFKAKTIANFAEKNIKKGSTISTDGFKAYKAKKVFEKYLHEYENYCDNEKPLENLHLIIGNLKHFVNGTFHGIDSKKLQNYLDEFCYRFNQRFMQVAMFGKLVASAANTAPHFLGAVRG